MCVVCHLPIGWTGLPFPIVSKNGMQLRPNTCAGCNRGFTLTHPAHHTCAFRERGFPFTDDLHSDWALPCGVQYHAQCIEAGEPFRTRFSGNQGLIYPWQCPVPHYVCELCQVRVQLGREIRRHRNDVALLIAERLRQLDVMNTWKTGTLRKYGPHLR